jgi:hypothetical protein
MPTDGTDFKRRRVHYGAFYIAAKTGAEEATLSAIGVAGLAREITKDFSLPMLKPMIDAAASALSGLFAKDGTVLFHHVQGHLKQLVPNNELGQMQTVLLDAVCRATGSLRQESGQQTGAQIVEALLELTGRDLYRAFVLDYAMGYIANVQSIHPQDIPAMEDRLLAGAAPGLSCLMRSIYESPSGRPGKDLMTAGPRLEPVDSSSFESLTNVALNLV